MRAAFAAALLHTLVVLNVDGAGATIIVALRSDSHVTIGADSAITPTGDWDRVAEEPLVVTPLEQMSEAFDPARLPGGCKIRRFGLSAVAVMTGPYTAHLESTPIVDIPILGIATGLYVDDIAYSQKVLTTALAELMLVGYRPFPGPAGSSLNFGQIFYAGVSEELKPALRACRLSGLTDANTVSVNGNCEPVGRGIAGVQDGDVGPLFVALRPDQYEGANDASSAIFRLIERAAYQQMLIGERTSSGAFVKMPVDIITIDAAHGPRWIQVKPECQQGFPVLSAPPPTVSSH
jgi:hypothetical protein